MNIEAKVDDREVRYATHRRMQWKIAFGVAGAGMVLGTAFGTAFHYGAPIIARYHHSIVPYFSR